MFETLGKVSRKAKNIVLGQINEIKKGGLPVLVQKGQTLLFAMMALPILIIVRILRPFVVIRFGTLISKRIGHFIGDTEMYIYEREAGMRGYGAFDVFYHLLPICNHQLEKMLKRTRKLRICPFADFMYTLDRVNHFLPYGRKHGIVTSSYDDFNLRARMKPCISFMPEEEALGRKALLQRLGISDADSFICFHVRDPAYLNTLYPDYDWRYHDYRNSNIYNYLPAVEELARRGHFMIRMGAVVKEALRTDNPRIIDYAVKGRTDFLDIYLCARCRFFISDDSGLLGVSMAFKRPIVFVNFIHFEWILSGGALDLFIPKKFWWRKANRFLTISEILKAGMGTWGRGEQYEEYGIDLVENTPEEIAAVAMEMEGRLNGTWQAAAEDEELQQRFWSFFKKDLWPKQKVLHVGAEFLRKNRDFLN